MSIKDLQAAICRMVDQIKSLSALRSIYQLVQKYFLREK